MKLCIITDIHKQPRPRQCLSQRLEASSGVVRLALNELCGRPNLSGETLHQHLFGDGGMDEAVSVLCQTLTGPCVGLGYSAGGTAIWRAAAAGFPFATIFCVSSTRLRDEVSIATPNHVFLAQRTNANLRLSGYQLYLISLRYLTKSDTLTTFILAQMRDAKPSCGCQMICKD